MRASGVLGQVLSACVLLFAVVLFNFILLHAAPGDPAEALASATGGATKEILEDIRRTYGLDRPLYQQFFFYVGNILRGDFGKSIYFNAPVAGLILERVPPTILLVGASLALAATVGSLLGTLAAQKPNGLLSHAISILSLIGFSAPVFWTGIILLLVFASWFPIFPVQGMTDPRISGGFFARALDVAHHLVLPALTLSSVYLAQYSRLSRTSMIDALSADYVRTARAKGLSERAVVYKHALRNAILPIVTVVGVQISHLLAENLDMLLNGLFIAKLTLQNARLCLRAYLPLQHPSL